MISNSRAWAPEPEIRGAASTSRTSSQQGDHRQPDVDRQRSERDEGGRLAPPGDASHRVSVRPGQVAAGWSAVDGTLVRVQIVILAGGVGGSRFVAGALRAYPEADVTVVGNTADDITLHGLRICPDLDTIMYTLGGGGDEQRGWGRQDESWRVLEELVSVRRRADLVRDRRSRSGHPPGANPAAERGLPAVRGDRSADPALAGRRAPGAAAADDRRPGRDATSPSPTRRLRAAAGRCTSRSTGCGCTPSRGRWR